MVLQRLHGLSDRDAVEAFEFDARWKDAAGGLDLGYRGFSHTVLVDMRSQLAMSDRPAGVSEMGLFHLETSSPLVRGGINRLNRGMQWRKLFVGGLVANCLISASTGAQALTVFPPAFASAIFNPAAVVSTPSGAVADPVTDRLYVADSSRNRVVAIEADGTEVTIPGFYNKVRAIALDPGSTHLWLIDPIADQVLRISIDGVQDRVFGGVKDADGIDADGSGVYVADTYDYRVVKKDRDTGADLWSVTSCFAVPFDRSRGITVGPGGKIFVADTDHNRVVVLEPATGACVRQFGVAGTLPGQMKAPRGIVGDGASGIYVGEQKGYRVQHLTDTGGFIASVGSQGDGLGQFRSANCLARRGTLLSACDPSAYRLTTFRITSTGGMTPIEQIWGDPPAPGGFNGAESVAYGPDGTLYAVDRLNHRVQHFAADGTFLSQWGGHGSGDGQFTYPRGITVDTSGPSPTVVVTDSENNRIQLFSTTGVLKRIVRPTAGVVQRPHYTIENADGTFWVTDTYHARVLRLSSTGVLISSITDSGRLVRPTGLAVAADGSLYVADTGSSMLLHYACDGTFLRVLATAGAGSTGVSAPNGIALTTINGVAAVLVADSANNRILALSTLGAALGSFGSKGSGVDRFNHPWGVDVDPANTTIAVADLDNNRVSLWR